MIIILTCNMRNCITFSKFVKITLKLVKYYNTIDAHTHIPSLSNNFGIGHFFKITNKNCFISLIMMTYTILDLVILSKNLLRRLNNYYSFER